MATPYLIRKNHIQNICKNEKRKVYNSTYNSQYIFNKRGKIKMNYNYLIVGSGLISQQKKVYCNEVPKTKFVDGIKKTIQWYLDNQKWWKNIISGKS